MARSPSSISDPVQPRQPLDIARLLRALGLLSGVLGCSAALSLPAERIPLWLRIAYALLAVSLTLLIEAPAWKKSELPEFSSNQPSKDPKPAEVKGQADVERTPFEMPLAPTAGPPAPNVDPPNPNPGPPALPVPPATAYPSGEHTRTWLQFSLIVLLALGTYIVGHASNANLTAETQQQLQACLQKLSSNPAAANPGHPAASTVQLDSDLQKALLEYLKRPPVAPAPVQVHSSLQLDSDLENLLREQLKHPAATPGSLSWPWFWLIFVALVVIGVVLYKHKEAAHEAGAVGLAAAVVGLALDAIKHPEHLSVIDDTAYKHFVLLPFAVLAVCCVLPFLVLAARFVIGKPIRSEEGSEKAPYLASLSFSVLALLWAMAMVTHHAPDDKPKDTPPPTIKISVETPIKSGPHYNRGLTTEVDPTASDDLKKKLVNAKLPKGSALLLFGSTDCYRFKRSSKITNDALAQGRATALKNYLKELKDTGLDIETKTLPQHISCSESPGLRAVYPFLIQAVESKSE